MSDDSENPSRRERKPLPDCLTRLLQTQCIEARQRAELHGSAASGSNPKTYMRVLAATWVQLDRLAQLSDIMVHTAAEPDAAPSKSARQS